MRKIEKRKSQWLKAKNQEPRTKSQQQGASCSPHLPFAKLLIAGREAIAAFHNK